MMKEKQLGYLIDRSGVYPSFLNRFHGSVSYAMHAVESLCIIQLTTWKPPTDYTYTFTCRIVNNLHQFA